jgi:hypothetical protein
VIIPCGQGSTGGIGVGGGGGGNLARKVESYCIVSFVSSTFTACQFGTYPGNFVQQVII